MKMNPFPAVILCGPPHVGKSTLTCSLTQALRARGVAHYVLRAAPDGEGDWACESSPDVVERIRRKGQWTDEWVRAICADVARRHLPLIVDMGGRPTPEQEHILDQCGYAILLTRTPDEHDEWRERALRHNLNILADLRSDLNGRNALESDSADGAIYGMVAGLSRHKTAQGPAFEALVSRMSSLSQWSEEALFKIHLANAPWQSEGIHVVNFGEWIHRLHPNEKSPRFTRADIPVVVNGIPQRAPVALYGRLWGELVVAISAKRDVRWVFQTSLGWVAPLNVRLEPASRADNDWLSLELIQLGPDQMRLSCSLHKSYLPYDELQGMAAPTASPDWRLEIFGKLPMWLASGLGIAYRSCREVVFSNPRDEA